ncbi:ATP-binding cassette domain-containing protein [Phosphitispora fastidiosa]|uniref:ATP-binding cassette domain-containing protein n=1 Tax=Phosphitispora fastidiosa TaxID=2837202 RepID=UPI001E5AB454|nr:ATP-binding cassette domain-containing protein [Phosphitispora fastidiosa]MBU7005994.1 ATPase subunit of ABC transporter with duplicated ATPase domains [Phosphitispora fastidiosa]
MSTGKIENINGKVDKQDKIGLIGVNGIGKTTLVKLKTKVLKQVKQDITGDIP